MKSGGRVDKVPPPPAGVWLPGRPLAPRSASLYLLGAPAGIGLPHVGGGLDGGDELEDGVADADEADDGAGDYAQDVAVQEDGADKDVEGAAADEAEEEGGVARDLGRDLELEEAGGFSRGQRDAVSSGASEGVERGLGVGGCIPRPKIMT